MRSIPTPPARPRTPRRRPFGIVYPPAYARMLDTTHDHLELRCVVEGGGEVTCEVRFLVPSGERHRAEAQRVAGSGDFRFGELALRTKLSVTPLEGERRLVSYRVENHTDAPADLDRAGAIARSLISTHPVLRVARGRFLSQLDAPCDVGQHVAGAGLARRRRDARGGDRAARPPADRPREPRQPVRQHRDRGGARAPRAGAQRRGARRDRAPGPGGQGDDRAAPARSAPRSCGGCTGA